MIFVLHYLLFNAGLPAVIILLTLFLQTYSSASLGQIGTLLMALPFVSILIKPLFCALADRQRAHRRYLIGALACMALGYGSLAVAPFFPHFLQQHGQLVWALDIAGIVLGYSAFGIAWSLGDALAVNGAQMAGVSWGSYRVWGVVSWGIVGVIIGQINELPWLPRYVAGLLVLAACLLAEIVVLALWPSRYFVMDGSLCESGPAAHAGAARPAGELVSSTKSLGSDESLHRDATADLESQWPASGGGGTLTAGGTLGPKVIGAVANILMEDLGGSLRSSLKLGPKAGKRAGLAELLDQHQRQAERASGSEPADGALQATGGLSRGGTLRRMMGLQTGAEPAGQLAQAPPSLSRAAALRSTSLAASQAAGVGPTQRPEEASAAAANWAPAAPLDVNRSCESPPAPARPGEDLQLVLLKLIIKRDRTIGKYLVLFTLFGFLLTCHLSYFYMHLERLCREKGNDFSSVTGGMLVTHSVSEILSFLVVPHYIPRVGRVGGLMTCALAYFVRFAYYGTYFVHNSPYTGVPFEFCHGIAYGIVYSLITSIAIECVNQVDEFMPELIERGLVDPNTPSSELKSPLRATMQGVFSGAFDGLGNGLGALFGGLYLGARPFTSLWRFCALVCVAIMVVYPLTEWRSILKRPREGQSAAQAARKKQVASAKGRQALTIACVS